MTMTRLLGAAAVAALLTGTAYAQTPAAPAPAAKPAAAPAPATTTAPAATVATPAPTPVATTAPAGQLVAKGDIVETLKGDPDFTTLVKALDATNLTEVLKKNTGLTVFAPTNAAFAALPAGELDRLMKDPAALQKVITYHLINATVDSTKIKGAKGGIKTVAGPELTVDGSGPSLMANNATIVQADVKATNGTVHVVDKVLMPAGAPAVAATTGTTSDAAATAPAQPAAPAATAPATPAPATPDPTTDTAEPAEAAPATPPATTPPEEPKL